MAWSKRCYSVSYESDVYNPRRYNPETDEYGAYIHDYGCNASTIKTARSYIARIRKDHNSENPRNFKIYDIYTDDDYAPVVYEEV